MRCHMDEGFRKKRYILGEGCSLSHTYGNNAGESTLLLSHYTKNCMFCYFIRGNANLKIEGRNYDAEEGDIIMVKPSELYMCEVYNEACHERLVLRVNPDIIKNFSDDGSALLSPFYDREKGKGNRLLAKNAESSGLHILFQEILVLAETESPASNVLAVCKTMDLLSQIGKLILLPDGNNGIQQEHPLINDVIGYLDGHFRDHLSVSSVASEFNIDKSYLSHLFKEYVGMPLWNYVICKRLNYFNDLICQNTPIEEACFSAGFQNYSNFFRLYKKYMNMTPLEFKKRKL